MVDMKTFEQFLSDEQGAITVDWVVMGASVVGLGMGTVTAVRSGAVSLGNDTRDSLTGASVAQVLGRISGLDTSATSGLQTTPWGWVATDSLQDWFTIGPNNMIELSRSGQRVTTPDGAPWIDMEYGRGNMTLARDLGDLAPGMTYTMTFNAADSAGNNGVDIYMGGRFVQSIAPGRSNTFRSYSVELVGGYGNGSNQLEFRSTGPQDSVGVSLHGINFQ